MSDHTSKFPVYENIALAGPPTVVKLTELSAKLRSLQVDPTKRKEVEELYEHICVFYYHHYTKTMGKEPDNFTDVPYIGKVCTGGNGLITNIDESFPFDLISYINTYVNQNTSN